MLSAPSIVIGLFDYAVAVATVGHFSGWAGSIALGLIAAAGLPDSARAEEIPVAGFVALAQAYDRRRSD